MNKKLEKQIEKIEGLKAKEIEKREAIDKVIAGYDNELKRLKDCKKQQEKIYQMQKDLDNKILGDKNES